MRPTTYPLLQKPPRFYHHFLRLELSQAASDTARSRKNSTLAGLRNFSPLTNRNKKWTPNRKWPMIPDPKMNEWMKYPSKLSFSRFKSWVQPPLEENIYYTNSTLVGGWTNPFEKCLSNYIISPGRLENKEYSKPPPKTYLTPGLANLSQELWLQRLHAKAATSEKTCWTWLA